MADGQQERPQLSRRDLARGKGRQKERYEGSVRQSTNLPPSAESISRQSLVHDESPPGPPLRTFNETQDLPRAEPSSSERRNEREGNADLAARVQQLILEGRMYEAQTLLAGGRETGRQSAPHPERRTDVDEGAAEGPRSSQDVDIRRGAYQERPAVVRVVQVQVNDIGDEAEVNEVLRKAIREAKGDGTISIHGVQGNEGVIDAITEKLQGAGFRVSVVEGENGVAYQIKALPVERNVDITDQEIRDAQGMIAAQDYDEELIMDRLSDLGEYEDIVRALASFLKLIKEGRASGKTRVESLADRWRHPSRDEKEYLEELRGDPVFAQRIEGEVEDGVYRQMEKISPRQAMLILDSLNLGKEMEDRIKSRLEDTWRYEVEYYETAPPTDAFKHATFRLEQAGLRLLEQESERRRAMSTTAEPASLEEIVQEEEDSSPEGQLLRGLGYRGRPMSASQVYDNLPDKGKEWIIGQKLPGADPEAPAEVAKVFIPMIESGQLPVDAKVLGALDGPLRIAVVNGLTGGRREEGQKILDALEGRSIEPAGHDKPHGRQKEEQEEREWKESDSWWVTRGIKKGVRSISGALKKDRSDPKVPMEPDLSPDERNRVDVENLSKISRSIGRKLSATPKEAEEIVDTAIRLAANGQLAQEYGYYSPEMAKINTLFKEMFTNPNMPTHLRERLDEAFATRLRDVAATGDKRSINQLLRVADLLSFDRELPSTNALVLQAKRMLA